MFRNAPFNSIILGFTLFKLAVLIAEHLRKAQEILVVFWARVCKSSILWKE